MSENWNKKQLNKRLSSIFSDLDDTTEIPGLSIFNTMSGWIWEINPQGIITKCSPDIEPFLGYHPDTIMNQPLSAISTFDLQEMRLPTSETATIVPTMIDITFYHIKGTKTSSVAYVLPRFDTSKKFIGWRGVTVLTPKIPNISLPKRPLASSTETELPLFDLISPDEIAEPVPSMLVNKPESFTDLSPETKEALELIEEDDRQHESEEILIEESFAIPQPQPSDEVKEFLKSIDASPERVWEPEELQLVEQVHSQLELALENANLFQQTQRALAETDEQARRLRLLNEMSEKLATAQNLQEIYTITVQSAHEIFLVDRTSLCVFTDNPEELEIINVAGEIKQPVVGETVTYQDSTHQTSLEEKRIVINSQINNPTPNDIQSSMVGPIISANKNLGTINFGSKKPNAFGMQDETFLAQLLTLLTSYIENRQLFEDIEKALADTDEQASRLRLLNEMSGKLAQVQELQEIYTIATSTTQEIFLADRTSLYILTEDKKELEVVSAAGSLLEPAIGTKFNVTEKFYQNNRTFILDTPEQEAGTSNPGGIQSTLVGPLIVAGEIIGNINISSTQKAPFQEQDTTFMSQLLNLVSANIENRRLFDQIQRRSIQLETSAEVSRIATTILDPAELLPEVVELIKNGFNLYYAGIFLIDESGDWTGEPGRWAVLRAGSGEAGQEMLAIKHKLEIGGDSMIGTSIANSEARITLDVGEEARFFRNPFLPDTHSEMALPLVSRGQVLGALSIQSTQEAAFTQEDITSLQTLADQLANAIENARLFEQTEIRAEELAVLNEMARSFTQTLDIEQLINIAYQFSGRLMDSENFYMALYDSETDVIEFKLYVEDGEKIPPPEPTLLLGEGLTDWIIKNKLPILMPSDTQKHIHALGLEEPGRISESWLGVPMLLENKVLGVIAVQSYDQPNTYGSHQLDLLSAVANQAAIAIDNAMRFQQTQARARFEQLLREITTSVHSSTNAESILRTAVREVSNALGKQAFIELNPSLDDESNGASHTVPQLLPTPDEEPQKGER